MTQAIVYSSKTGNTKLLAETIQSVLPACQYCGAPCDSAREADILFVGFWTDKGQCDDSIAAFLESLENKKVFLFGTAGFGGDPAYFAQILDCVAKHLPSSVECIGSYMCQGKMPMTVRNRYMKMKETGTGIPNVDVLIANFDAALSHPDTADLELLKAAVEKAL